jgi:hypothetical protein
MYIYMTYLDICNHPMIKHLSMYYISSYDLTKNYATKGWLGWCILIIQVLGRMRQGDLSSRQAPAKVKGVGDPI